MRPGVASGIVARPAAWVTDSASMPLPASHPELVKVQPLVSPRNDRGCYLHVRTPLVVARVIETERESWSVERMRRSLSVLSQNEWRVFDENVRNVVHRVFN